MTLDVVQDSPVLNRNYGVVSLNRKNPTANLDEVSFSFDWFSLEAELDNYTQRPAGALKWRYDIDQTVSQARGSMRFSPALGWKGVAGADLRFNGLDTRRFDGGLGHDFVNSYHRPAIEEWWGGLFGDLTYAPKPDMRFQAGLRYDAVAYSADDQYLRPATGTASYDVSPRQLYETYYGVHEDTDRVLHDINLRLRGEWDVAPGLTLYGDAKRLLRPGDLSERYKGSSGPATLREVGNPWLRPERHHVIEVGEILKGRAGPGNSDRPISGSLASSTAPEGPEPEQEHGTQEETEPLGGIQGASGDSGAEGRQDAGRAGPAV